SLREVLEQAKVAVHAVWGLQDPTMDHMKLHAWWNQHMQHKNQDMQSLSLWDDCGHWIMHQSPTQLAAWFRTHT
ncbi:MAG: hypothetical protein ACOVO6_02050, partial [Burkholderiaceae bacterium]